MTKPETKEDCLLLLSILGYPDSATDNFFCKWRHDKVLQAWTHDTLLQAAEIMRGAKKEEVEKK